MELIDREKLKQQVDPSGLMFNNGMSKDYKRGFTDGLIRCYELITRQPTVNTWISVEDRLPSERDWYLVKWKEKSTEFVGVPKIADFLGIETEHTTQNGWMFQEELPIEYLKDLEVIAWMPIPEYKEQEDD